MHLIIGLDERSRIILRNTTEAMEKGYSHLLINDWVLPDTGSPLLPAAMDINMMALLSGMEKTEKHWHALWASVGLTIVKIWQKGPETESLINAVVE